MFPMNKQMKQNHSPIEILYVNSKKVSCDGGKGASNHPLVYLTMGEGESVVCPYCSKYFTTKKNNQSKIVSKTQNKKE